MVIFNAIYKQLLITWQVEYLNTSNESNLYIYFKRIKLMKEFILRMEQENNVILYIVEMVYQNQEYMIKTNQPNININFIINHLTHWIHDFFF